MGYVHPRTCAIHCNVLISSLDFHPSVLLSVLLECRSALTSVDLLTKPEHGPLVVEKDAANMTRFLNRILGLPTKLQNKMFAYFTETVVAIVQQAKRMGRWDSGILGEFNRGKKTTLFKKIFFPD